MRVSDIVSFSKEHFYNGAVQTEWFYDLKKRNTIAESYVFHGPKYYGVAQTDVKAEKHKLIDTASFAKKLTDKIYSDKPDNCFVMNIAGYGTGKSHLAVCLGTLFEGDPVTRKTIAANIASADAEIGEYILRRNTDRNLVIVLNGMNNFNLDAEMLRCVRLSLKQAGVSDAYLQKLTKSYDIARHFVENMYDFCQSRFVASAKRYDLAIAEQSLKKYLLSKIEAESRVLQVINDVYEQINGDQIAWDRGLSAGDILLATQAELCGKGKPFHKILILFDEFGRYIEYTAANPAIAGEAALQQIFEAVQSANGKIIFVGFIQNELRAYLSRIDNTGNVSRYIGRYDTACDPLHLSSNFETILANILKKQEPSFSRAVGTAVGKYERYHKKMQAALNRWDRAFAKKGVWTSNELYRTVILQGCYPLHPITVWLLSGSHAWMQQRSTLAFSADMFDGIASSEIEGTWLPYIYPAQIIDSGIFNEMLSAEEKGLVSSQYCMLYRDIETKIGDKLTPLEKTVLKSILVINMGRMAFLDKPDALTAVQYCSGLKEDEVNHAIKSLENSHGVIAFDETAKIFDFLAEASGFNEFQRLYIRYRIGETAKISDLDQNTREQLKLSDVIETSFGQENNISSTEWCFTQRLHASTDITELYLQNVIREITSITDGENPRGVLIYAYCAHNAETECKRIAALYRKMSLDKQPILILWVSDPDEEIVNGIIVKKVLRKFKDKDQARFKKHIDDQERRQSRKIIARFNQSVTKREMITASGKKTYTGRLNALCSQHFTNLFYRPAPFVFDGFQNKNKTQAKTALTNLCVGLLNNSLTNPQVFAALTPKEKNRIIAVMSTTAPNSWKVFNDGCQLVLPQNPLLNEMVCEIMSSLETGERKNVDQLFAKYLGTPYGLNDNSLALLVSYFIAFHGKKYYYYYGMERLSEKHWKEERTGKFKLPDVHRIAVQKNKHIDVDPVAEMCAEILANTQIDKCAQFKIRLNELITQEGDSESNKTQIAQAIAYLDVGFRLVKSTREKTAKAHTTFEANSKKFDILQATQIFDMIPAITPRIEEGYLYEYSESYKKDIADLQSKLTKLFEREFAKTVAKISCEITELSELKHKYDRAVKILRGHGYSHYADEIEARMVVLERDLLAKQRYEKVLAEVEKDIALSVLVQKYQGCCEMIVKLKYWHDYFEKIKDLPSDTLISVLQRIDHAIGTLEQKKNSMFEEVDSLIRWVRTVNTLVELKETERKLERFAQMGLDEARNIDIIAAQEDVHKAIETIEAFPHSLDELARYIKKISARSNPHCWQAIKACAMTEQSRLEKKQKEWVAEYLLPAEKQYSEMTQRQCEKWMKDTANVPEYISGSICKRIEKARTLVEGRLHNSRVEHLISLYDQLSESEKTAFKRMLVGRN